MRPGGRPWRTSSKLAFVAYRINGGVLDKKLAEKEWLCFVGGWGGVPPEAFCAEKKAFTSFRDAINDLFVDDEENGLMRNPEEEFLDRGDETCEYAASEEEYEDDDSQKDDGSVEESESGRRGGRQTHVQGRRSRGQAQGQVRQDRVLRKAQEEGQLRVRGPRVQDP
mmetsp:Transcript_19107/g.43305  ORF Transcript_19107/g.43305 Transcript_19107/m.43305 type:complete len:167 (+) Transcript_19107:103-603(+)